MLQNDTIPVSVNIGLSTGAPPWVMGVYGLEFSLLHPGYSCVPLLAVWQVENEQMLW
jgi:hypothetical protein